MQQLSQQSSASPKIGATSLLTSSASHFASSAYWRGNGAFGNIWRSCATSLPVVVATVVVCPGSWVLRCWAPLAHSCLGHELRLPTINFKWKCAKTFNWAAKWLAEWEGHATQQEGRRERIGAKDEVGSSKQSERGSHKNVDNMPGKCFIRPILPQVLLTEKNPKFKGYYTVFFMVQGMPIIKNSFSWKCTIQRCVWVMSFSYFILYN